VVDSVKPEQLLNRLGPLVVAVSENRRPPPELRCIMLTCETYD
jgi:hypothetical protein